MSTQAEAVARKMLDGKTCMNCAFSRPALKRGKPVLYCALADRRTLPCMLGCYLWERSREDLKW